MALLPTKRTISVNEMSDALKLNDAARFNWCLAIQRSPWLEGVPEEMNADTQLELVPMELVKEYMRSVFEAEGNFDGTPVYSKNRKERAEMRRIVKSTEKLELENEKSKGNLVYMSDVIEEFSDRIVAARSIMLSVVPVAVQIYRSAGTEIEFETWMRQEIHRALAELARQQDSEDAIELRKVASDS